MAKILEVNNLHVYYGNIHALKGLNLEVNEGEIVALIGANGAGKTTLLGSIMKQTEYREGKVSFMGKSLDHAQTAEIVQNGMTLVPEGRHIFPRLSVYDNLLLGSYFRKNKAEVKKDFAKVLNLFPRLEERRRQLAGTLSGGEQQMLAMGRALMSKPKLLLLDEPSMGLAPIIVKQIFKTILDIRRDGATILLVEQNANLALKIAQRAYVLETGNIVLSGLASELLNNENVKKAYLGE